MKKNVSKDVSDKQKETEVAKPAVVIPDDKDSKKPEAAENRARKPGKTVKAAKPSRLPLLVALLALLVALLSLAATGYIAWHGKPLADNQSALMSGQEMLQSQIARQQARLTETIQSFAPVEQELRVLQERDQRLLSRVDTVSRHLKELAGSNRDGWQLAEVEYLLRLANQKLLMTADVSSAKALLSNADSILQDLDDYALYPVRAALAEDLAGLRMVPEFDQEGLYLRLSALGKQVEGLPLLKPEGFEPARKTTGSETVKTDDEGWQTAMLNMPQNTWNNFTSLFRFNRDRSKPVTPLLTQEENLLVRQNLRLLIEQTKLALLAREQGIYEESLQQTGQWVEHYFEMSGAAATGMLQEIEQLSSVTVRPVLPNINRALDALKLHISAEPAEAAEPSATGADSEGEQQ